MSGDLLERFCYKIYKSVPPAILGAMVPAIDFVRKLNSKPPIPFEQKFAKNEFPTFSDKVIMLHGVSVGEVQSLENLIKKIKEEFIDYKIVLTTGTVTGQELAYKKYGEIVDYITYFPFDTYLTVEKFLNKIKPSVVLIAETELWPNFSYCAKAKNIPLYIINGRISDKSYPSYLKIKKFIKLILNSYTGLFCQSELDAERFINLGAQKNTVKVMKNLKFEIEKKPCDIDLKQNDFKVFIAGSTHSGEDEIVIRTYQKLKQQVSNLKLILAPRHLTRMDEVEQILNQYNCNYGYRTKNDTFINKDIIILDTIGELSKIYAIADVAFIGGSFNSTGGHNPLEAIIYSKPVISGPSIKNFRDIYSILERESAAFVVKNEKEFLNVAQNLFIDESFYKNISINCEKCFKNQQGALSFVIDELKAVL